MAIGIDYGKFLDFMALEDVGSLFKVCRLGCGDKVFSGHHLADGTVEVALETEVTVGDYADQLAVVVDHWYASDVVFFHQAEGIAHCRFLVDCDRVVDHAVFSALHSVHLAGLFGDWHVFVDYTDSAFTGDGDC
jgi:hypothetical protein